MNQPTFLLVIGSIACVIFLLLGLGIVVIYLIIARKKGWTDYISSKFKSFTGWVNNQRKEIFRKNNAITIPEDNMMKEENTALLKKITSLEQEIASIKSSLVKYPPSLREKIQKVFLFISHYWIFFSFIGSIILAIYIQYRFHVDYFESVRDISTQKKLSTFYRTEGDQQLDAFEFGAAKGYYTKALEIDPNDELASYRLAISQVFEPEEGQRYFDVFTAERKLDFLLSEFPNDYHLYLVKADLYDKRHDANQARVWTEKALQLNPNCSPCNVELGYLNQESKGNILESAKYYEKALETDPNNVYALNNLGDIYLLSNDYVKANQNFNDAYYWSPRLITLMSWGDVALFSNDLESAKSRFEDALNYLNDPDLKPTEYYLGDNWTSNYIPQYSGDTETIKKFEIISTINDKEIMGYYDLSFSYALLGDLEKANELFAKANTLDSMQQYNQFYASKLVSIKNIVPIKNNRISSWIDDQILKLNQNQ